MTNLTLRRRLTLLVAMAIVVPITVVGVMVVNLIGNQADARALDRLRLTADHASSTLSALDQRLHARAEALASDPRLGSAVTSGEADLEAYLRQSLDVRLFDIVVVAAPDGSVIGGISREPELVAGVAPPTLDEVVSGVAAAVTSTATAPFGTVVLGQWLDATQLARLSSSDRITVSLVAPDGRLIATSAAIGDLPSRPLVGEFAAPFGGEERFAVATPVPAGRAGGAVLLVSSRTDLIQSRTGLVAILGGVLLVLLVLVVLVGYVVGGLVTGPVDALAEAAHAVAQGDLSKRVEPTGDRELAALGTAFNQMTDNLRKYVTELQHSRAEFQSAMTRLGDVLVSTHDIGGIIDVVLEAATLTLKADLAVFFERIAMPARIRASAVWSAEHRRDPSAVPEMELNGTGVAGTAALELIPCTFPGTGWLDLAEPVVSSAIAVPVLSSGRLFGVLAVYGRSGESLFSPEDVDTLQTLARQTEVAVGNVMLHDETRRQARTDGLTGLWNRREFELRAGEAVKEAERFDEPFGIIVVDIDDFKLVNDLFDHSTGDAALIWIASRLSEATREIDVVARWGGEEFIILLPRAGADETAVVAERVRRTVAREPMVDGAKRVALTVSLGYAVRPVNGRTPDELFKAADNALLQAKRNGKNRAQQATDHEGDG